MINFKKIKPLPIPLKTLLESYRRRIADNKYYYRKKRRFKIRSVTKTPLNRAIKEEAEVEGRKSYDRFMKRLLGKKGIIYLPTFVWVMTLILFIGSLFMIYQELEANPTLSHNIDLDICELNPEHEQCVCDEYKTFKRINASEIPKHCMKKDDALIICFELGDEWEGIEMDGEFLSEPNYSKLFYEERKCVKSHLKDSKPKNVQHLSCDELINNYFNESTTFDKTELFETYIMRGCLK